MHAPISNPPITAQLGGIPYHTTSPSYIWVRAIMWACGRGQTDRQTHRRAWPQYISCRLRLKRNVIITTVELLWHVPLWWRPFFCGFRHLANRTKNSAVSPAYQKNIWPYLPRKDCYFAPPTKNWGDPLAQNKAVTILAHMQQSPTLISIGG